MLAGQVEVAPLDRLLGGPLQELCRGVAKEARYVDLLRLSAGSHPAGPQGLVVEEPVEKVVEEAAAKLAEAQAHVDTATQQDEDEDRDDGASENLLGEADLKALKKEVSAAKKNLKTLRSGFLERLEEATAVLSEEESRRLALGIAREDLEAQLDRYVGAHRREIVASVENWWDKYRVSAREIEAERDATARRLAAALGELGYARAPEYERTGAV